jgi:nicotinamide phosphoribosyltransferase
MNPIFLIDFYKVGHINQYPEGVTQVWSNWTPRTSRVEGTDTVVHFGLNYFIKKYLLDQFEREFFSRPWIDIADEYRKVIRATLGVQDPRMDHIYDLHALGYLPITIYSLPEGTSVPLNIPPIIITNTHPDFFWLPNYFETIMSSVMWMPCTSATTARRYRKVFLKYARESGETDFSFIDWQGHDFSFRGMPGPEAAILSGMGHLTQFSGTDTIPAILAANKYYGADLSCGGSVPATEHSVMSAGGKEDELGTFRRLLTEVYPTGIVSVVSDTWDLWKVLTEYIPALKSLILGRDGKLVIRPDSGDPVNIICGNPLYKNITGREREFEGTLRLLAKALGVSEREGMLPLINKAGAIYGDSITVERAENILKRIVHELKLSPYNMVFGIGSFTYQYVTRDTYGWAMKATAVRKDGEIIPIFKKPVTDDGGKFSHKGILAVYNESASDDPPSYYLVQNATEDQLNNCAYQKVFINSALMIDPSFETIRKRARAGL